MPMELELGPEAEAFRQEVREFLEANMPSDLVGVSAESAEVGRQASLRLWTETLYENRMMCVSWPTSYGGRGLTGVEVAVLNEEFARSGVPRMTRGMGEWLVGPSIIVHGTEEQKKRFLPRIIDGTDTYCQGFSEPDAGSDLAAVKTRGIIDGDELVINGQKVWTSGAHNANMMFCLARTDPDVPKHRGISYVLVPMSDDEGGSNGIELRPIRQITGNSHFFETFMTDSRAPLENVIGGLNNGWRVAMTTLGNERGGNATTQHVQFTKQFWKAVEAARAGEQLEDAVTRQNLAWAWTHVEIMRYAGLRTLSEVVAQKEPGPRSAINKMFWSEYSQRFTDLMINVIGAPAMVRPSSGEGDYPLDEWQSAFMSDRSATIWGGTAEVQRNIVGERVLGLPKEPLPPELAAKQTATGS